MNILVFFLLALIVAIASADEEAAPVEIVDHELFVGELQDYEGGPTVYIGGGFMYAASFHLGKSFKIPTCGIAGNTKVGNILCSAKCIDRNHSGGSCKKQLFGWKCICFDQK